MPVERALDDQKEAAPDAEDSEVEIEIVDDTPEEDRGRPRRPEGHEPEIPDDDELKDHSKRVQDRIRKLRWEYHEERRAREEAERLRDEAIRLAQSKMTEAEKLRRFLAEGEKVHVVAAREAAEARVKSAKQALRAATEAGDAEKIVEAQEELAKAVTEAKRWEGYQPRYQIPEQPHGQPQAQGQAPTRVQTQPQAPRPTPQALEWAARNPWFGRDMRMTRYARDYHEYLVNEEGVVPDTPEYYEKLDREIERVFHRRDEEASPRQRKSPAQAGTVVAPGSRSAGKPRKVVLTETQVRLARRLGLTPEQYAAEYLKLEQNS